MMFPRASLMLFQKSRPVTWCSFRYYCQKQQPEQKNIDISEGSNKKMPKTDFSEGSNEKMPKTDFSEGSNEKMPKIDISEGSNETTSLLQKLFVKFDYSPDMIASLHRNDLFSVTRIEERTDELHWKSIVNRQMYNSKRHNILGSNLSAAYFVLSHGGAVKFNNAPTWFRPDEKGKYHLPNKFVPNMYIEAIDASSTDLLYEGFSNFGNLFHLKSLKINNCKYVDDWCLDRLHIFAPTELEYLDISSCQQITENGLCSLHKIRKLKTLVAEDLTGVKSKDLIYMMIEDLLPGITIIDSKRQSLDVL